MLRAAYMGTLMFAGIKALASGKRVTVYLTQMGGGVFGNDEQWITSEVYNAVTHLKFLHIDVKNVFYGTQFANMSPGWSQLHASLQSVIKSGAENQK